MKQQIDDATKAILGPCKDGFEWVEMPADPIEPMRAGDVAITHRGLRYQICGPADNAFEWGVALGTGKFYRQVPIEPEPEVIWDEPGKGAKMRRRIYSDGRLTYTDTYGREFDCSDHHTNAVAKAWASQHAALKKAREQLREIKEAADACVHPSSFRAQVISCFIDKARALEVE